MGVSTTFVSQVFRGDKRLSLEQGVLVCEYFGLTELETEYFLKLILVERAGTVKLKALLRAQAERIKDKSAEISSWLDVKKVLPEKEKAIFYSEWHFSAIALLIGVPGYQDLESISRHLGLPRKMVGDAIQHLLQMGLVVRENDTLKVGPSRTHLDANSPFIKLHHSNWRIKALEHMAYASSEELHYSAPMTLAARDVPKVRAFLLEVIAKIGKIVDPSPPEDLMCLNLDWFEVRPLSGKLERE